MHKHFLAKSQVLRPQRKTNPDSFVIHNGIRFVKPYLKQRKTFAKERWLHRDILSVYCEEFTVPRSVCRDMLSSGRILINEQAVSPCYVVRPHDVLTTMDMVVEKPILNIESIRVLPNLKTLSSRHHTTTTAAMTASGASSCATVSGDVGDIDGVIDLSGHYQFFAIQKPHGVPIHAVGKFIRNSLSAILQDEYQLKTRFVHRLDKCTSGVLICGTSVDAVKLYHDLSTNNRIEKYYLARVKGRFPDVCCVTPKTRVDNDDIHRSCSSSIAVHHVTYPLVMVSQRRGLWDPIVNGQVIESVINRDTTDKKPVDAYTMVIGMHYCEATDQSIVLCQPITGRTHQIRCHLRGMGHAIVGDDRIPEFSSVLDWDKKYAILMECGSDEQRCSQVCSSDVCGTFYHMEVFFIGALFHCTMFSSYLHIINVIMKPLVCTCLFVCLLSNRMHADAARSLRQGIL